jgi:transcription-repair coupling factor (superfamily II helicase)
VVGGKAISGVALLEWARTVIDAVIDPPEQKPPKEPS